MLAITPHAWTPPHVGTNTQPQTHRKCTLEAHTHITITTQNANVLFLFAVAHSELYAE